MRLTRRSFLRIAGSGAVIAAAGGGWLGTRTPVRALEPWKRAGSGRRDPRHHALSYAILAPNPHNLQPWQVDLSHPGRATLLCDPTRRLPETDPFSRQIVIGLGCFVELAVIAATQTGTRVDVEAFPEGVPADSLDGRPVAHLHFTQDGSLTTDPLFHQILRRRSNKEPYDTGRAVGVGELARLERAALRGSLIRTSADPGQVQRLRGLTWQALQIELKTPRTYMESVKLMRFGRAEIETNPDGIDMGGPLLETLGALGQLDRDKLADMNSGAYRQGAAMWERVVNSAMAYAWLGTPGNTREQQLVAGRDYVRLHLQATELGLAMHPLSQALQEFSEMEPTLDAVHGELGIPTPGRVQMLARLGYAGQVAPSPRWPLESRILRT